MIALMVASLLLAQTASPPSAGGHVTMVKVQSPEKALRFEITVPAPLGDVWTAFSTTDGLATWLWSDVRVDLRPGGDWLVLYPGGKTGGGTVVSFEPGRRLTLKALAPEQFPAVREQRTTAVFAFEAVTPQSTKVTLVQTGWQSGDEWDRAYEYLADGNAVLLRQLHRRFVNGPMVWKP